MTPPAITVSIPPPGRPVLDRRQHGEQARRRHEQRCAGFHCTESTRCGAPPRAATVAMPGPRGQAYMGQRIAMRPSRERPRWYIWRISAFVFSAAGMVTRYIVRSEIKRTGETGRSMKRAGLIICFVGVAFKIVVSSPGSPEPPQCPTHAQRRDRPPELITKRFRSITTLQVRPRTRRCQSGLWRAFPRSRIGRFCLPLHRFQG
jgi:hypothetical protein